MSATDGLGDLLERLRTDAAFRASFNADPMAATEAFDITGHERDAVVTRDCDDFVALGVVSSPTELPAALGCGRRRTLAELIAWLKRLMRGRLRGPFRPDLDRGPWPVPDPLPEPPRPGPRPGPDPPGPDG